MVTVRLSAAVQHTDRFTWNGDHVTVEAVVLRPGVVQLTIAGVGAGESMITLFAEAPGHQAAEASFTVEVWNPEEFYVDVAKWVERYWSFRLPEVGATYRPIGAFQGYDSPISTPCGPAEPGDAFYCSINRGIYYDTAFFADYLDRVGQMAPAVIIAHEFGHHVSWELGIREINSLKQEELQADCLAGAWARSVDESVGLEPEDLQQAARTMFEIGQPEHTWFDTGRHGTMQQRVEAFARGFDTGWLMCIERDWLAPYGEPEIPSGALPGAVTEESLACRDASLLGGLAESAALAVIHESEELLEQALIAVADALQRGECAGFSAGDSIEWEGEEIRHFPDDDLLPPFDLIRVLGSAEDLSGARLPASLWWVLQEQTTFGDSTTALSMSQLNIGRVMERVRQMSSQ